MTPKPESETDPWKAIQRYEFVQTNFAYTTDHEMERDAEGEWARWEAVDAARAAEAAQHRQFKAAIATALCVENEHGPVSEESIVEAAEVTLGQLFDLSARLAAVEAERDKAQRALATAYLKARRQASVCEPNEDQFAGAMAVVAAAFPNTRVEATAVRIAKPEEPTELVVAVKRRAERAEAERDRLKAAFLELHATVKGECPSLLDPDRGGSDVLWALCAAALTPQGQSTDGETR